MDRTMRLLLNAVGAVRGGGASHLRPFLTALLQERPNWDITACVSSEARIDLADLPIVVRKVDFAIQHKRPWSMAQRAWWDGFAVDQLARSLGAAATVHLANSGPIWPSLPAIVYQRNAYYFDQAWLATRTPREQRAAAARRAAFYCSASFAELVVVPSRAMADLLRCWPGWRRTPLLVVPHGVDLGRFADRSKDHCARLLGVRQSGRPVRLLAVSDPLIHKDLATAVATVAALVARGIQATLAVTVSHAEGTASVANVVALVEQARLLGVEERLELLGTTPDVERLYAEADALLWTSRVESFGFPVVEAMACGLPVISSALPSAVELLGDTGLLFPPGDAEAAADHVKDLLQTSEQELTGRLRGARRRAERYTWTAAAGALAEAVEGAIDREPTGVAERSRLLPTAGLLGRRRSQRSDIYRRDAG